MHAVTMIPCVHSQPQVTDVQAAPGAIDPLETWMHSFAALDSFFEKLQFTASNAHLHIACFGSLGPGYSLLLNMSFPSILGKASVPR